MGKPLPMFLDHKVKVRNYADARTMRRNVALFVYSSPYRQVPELVYRQRAGRIIVNVGLGHAERLGITVILCRLDEVLLHPQEIVHPQHGGLTSAQSTESGVSATASGAKDCNDPVDLDRCRRFTPLG